MQIPKNFMDVAGEFQGLSPERKQQILQHFASLPEESRKATYDQIQRNGGIEAEFAKAIFEQPAKAPAAAPQAARKASPAAAPSKPADESK